MTSPPTKTRWWPTFYDVISSYQQSYFVEHTPGLIESITQTAVLIIVVQRILMLSSLFVLCS